LDRYFDGALEEGRAEIAWSRIACILALARFCAPSSELQIADFWYEKTALDDLLDVPSAKVNDDRLYRGLDVLLPHKDGLFRHFQQMYGELFWTTFDLLLYDITSTYFEGQGHANPQARHGYSRDGRPDCIQVCIALVVTPEGLPLAYEVFDGNRADVTTVEEMVDYMRERYGQERRTWVMDRGMVSEENLAMLRASGATYLVGTPKSMLRRFERELLAQGWTHVEPGVDVKLCAAPDGTAETYVLCRSPQRSQKERAMRARQIQRLEKELAKLNARCEAVRNPLRDAVTAERRIGALLQRYSRAAHLYEVVVKQTDEGTHSGKPRLRLHVTHHDERRDWAEHADGCYLLRTNLHGHSAQELWRTYIGLTQIEDSFRISKHDLGLRPIYHQKADRTQAHILVCFLALVLWRALQHWMTTAGLGQAPRKLLEEMAQIRSLDVLLPTAAGPELRLRVVSRPENHLAILLQHLNLFLPNRPKSILNVVQKIAAQPPNFPVNAHS
jgi:transposase